MLKLLWKLLTFLTTIIYTDSAALQLVIAKCNEGLLKQHKISSLPPMVILHETLFHSVCAVFHLVLP